MIELVKILRKAQRVKPHLIDNLREKTEEEANYLNRTDEEILEAYQFDWEWYGTALGDLMETSNQLRELDDQADHLIDFLENLYVAAMELELEADQADYPEDHAVYRLVSEIEKIFNMELD